MNEPDRINGLSGETDLNLQFLFSLGARGSKESHTKEETNLNKSRGLRSRTCYATSHSQIVFSTVVFFFSILAAVECRIILPKNQCKLFIQNKLYNFEGINGIWQHNTTIKGEKYVIQGSICRSLNASKGINANVVINKVNDDTIREVSYPNNQTELKWTASEVGYEDPDELAMIHGSAIKLRYTPNVAKEPLIKKVVFVMECFNEGDFVFNDTVILKSNVLLFKYVGKAACSMEITDQIGFLQNKLPIYLMLLTSLLGLFVSKDHDRLAMTLASIQATIMIVTTLFINLAAEWVININLVSSERAFVIAVLVSVFLVSGASFFSRYVALTFVCFAMSFAVVYTLLYAYMVIFKQYVAYSYYVIATVLCVGGIVWSAWRYAQIRERYAFVIFTSVTNSFYLCLSSFILLHFYIDIATFNRYKDYGKIDEIKFENWSLLLMQLLLTLVLVTLQLRRELKLTRYKEPQMYRERILTEADSENNFFRGSSIKHPVDDATVIAM